MEPNQRERNEAGARGPDVPQTVRQAVVIVHGMGEQRPLDMLNGFIEAALPGRDAEHPDGGPVFYSRPDEVADSYESRRFLARERASPGGEEMYAQTEFYEYHWAHLMQGNRLSDMWSTLRRMLLQLPWKVPSGLIGIWAIFWVAIAGVAATLFVTGFDFGDFSVNRVVSAVLGGGVVAAVATWLLTNFLPGKVSSTFVDVVRYLDTSPRSYAVRKAIREGMVELLIGLHLAERYQRIVVVAHSLGAYVAYDGITYLWAQMNQLHCARAVGPMSGDAITELEDAAAQLLAADTSADPTRFRRAQRALWLEHRRQQNPWLITDFVTCGTPMYMADQLMTTDRDDFEQKVLRRHIATCPPQPDLPGPTPGKTLYSYPHRGGPVLYHAAPFAVTRWTNLWFPARGGFFGDWFGGPLAPLFGNGIRDIDLHGNRPGSLIPALAHTKYFSFAMDEHPGSVTKVLQEAMELDSTEWLEPTLGYPPCGMG